MGGVKSLNIVDKVTNKPDKKIKKLNSFRDFVDRLITCIIKYPTKECVSVNSCYHYTLCYYDGAKNILERMSIRCLGIFLRIFHR